MGNTNSSCTVVNEARYEICVEVFSPKDNSGDFAQRKLTLLPGQQCSLPSTKKGLQLRISGNGRTQDLIRAAPGEVVSVRKVKRGVSAPQVHAVVEEGEPEQPAEQQGQQLNAGSAAAHQKREDEQQAKDWLDEKDKHTKDELEQLVTKLRKESVRDERVQTKKQGRGKGPGKAIEEGGIQRQPRDKLSAQIAALQQKNNSQSFFTNEGGERSEEETEDTEPRFEVNTDTQTDELMAAINRLSKARSHHAKKNSWERGPQIFAHT